MDEVKQLLILVHLAQFKDVHQIARVEVEYAENFFVELGVLKEVLNRLEALLAVLQHS